MVTLERLKEVLHYDPKTGVFTRLVKTNRNQAIGEVVQRDDKHGYYVISLDGDRYRSSRLAWFYVFGTWPKYEIDHINGNRRDDRIDNLRDIPCTINRQNQRKPQPRNTTGYLGVCKHQGKFMAQIGINRNTIYLGMFDTADAAHEAYIAAKRKLHDGCTI